MDNSIDAAYDMERKFTADFIVFGERMKEQHATFMVDSLLYKREHGHFKWEEPAEIFKSHLKFAISKGGKICFVHNETMVAYKTSAYPYYKTSGEYPNTEIDDDFVFERWCTGFDF